MSRVHNNWTEIHPAPPGIDPYAIRHAPPVVTNPQLGQPMKPPGQQHSAMNPPADTHAAAQLPSPRIMTRPPLQVPPMSTYILPPPDPLFGQPKKRPGQYPGIPAAFSANHPVQVVQMVRIPFSSRSMCLTCPNCDTEIYTKVEYEAGRMTHLAAAVIFLLGGLCLACLPYCANDFKDATHACPECGMFLGLHRR